MAFFHHLQTLRGLYLQDALKRTVRRLDIGRLDTQLALFVEPVALQKVASFGLRGESVFPVPYLLEADPRLPGYYRLLYGLSQKEFCNAGPFGRFFALEDRGEVPPRAQAQLPALCRSLAATGAHLVDGLDVLSLQNIAELQLLTVGPYLRGSENTRIGQAATLEVVDIIKNVVGPAIRQETKRTLLLENPSGRTVVIEFANDPDVRIEESMVTGNRPLVSMEIKGGTDASNIHNRLGEAEKSHQKARGRRFREFWTLVRCDIADDEARRESPTTSHFFHIDRLKDPDDSQYL
ncbi:MAG: XcyI family restriction endonuclease, partial [Armatimonadetes bacterium]|nr:XcyI family restriction endonuclease [Armatimonadota bacterium]